MERIDMLWEPVRVILVQVGEFFPRVMLAFGAYLARFVGAAVATYCKGISLPDAAVVGRLAFWAVLVFVVLVALDQLGLGDIIRQSFLIVLAAIALGFALAFGIGGQK